MSSNHFVVSEIATVWQYSFRGEIAGPFRSRELAVEAAIAEASVTEIEDVQVIVQDADLKAETVWKRGG